MSNILKGGLSDKMSLEDIARKHSQFIGTIKQELKKGINVEREHTTNKNTATEIAMDHISEDPKYYEKLDKMEKGKCNCDKKEEAKEQTMADASGSFEAPINEMPPNNLILKRDIHNFATGIKPQKIEEVADSGISAGAMYDAPIGHKAKDPLEIDNPKGGGNGTILGNPKTDKKSIAVKNPKFPKYVKGGKFVAINTATQAYPYRNQGDPKNTTLYEIHGMKEAVQKAAKKYGLSIAQVETMIIKESKQISEALPVGIDFSPASTWGNRGDETKYIYHIITMDSKEQEPAPLDFKSKDKDAYHKLKAILLANGTKFKEERHPITGETTQAIEPSKEENLYVNDDDTDFVPDKDDIFTNMK